LASAQASGDLAHGALNFGDGSLGDRDHLADNIDLGVAGLQPLAEGDQSGSEAGSQRGEAKASDERSDVRAQLGKETSVDWDVWETWGLANLEALAKGDQGRRKTGSQGGETQTGDEGSNIRAQLSEQASVNWDGRVWECRRLCDGSSDNCGRAEDGSESVRELHFCVWRGSFEIKWDIKRVESWFK
jgi:hypothetical protein